MVLVQRWWKKEKNKKKIKDQDTWSCSIRPTLTSSYFLVVFFRVCLVMLFFFVFFAVAGGW